MQSEIRSMTNKHPDFYPLMGRFLANRKVASELGMKVWDDDNKLWFMALQGNQVLGFASIKFKGAIAELASAWVRPDFRGQGLYTRLLEERLRWLENPNLKYTEARCTCTEMSYHGLVKHGFKPIGRKGKYTQMRRGLNR